MPCWYWDKKDLDNSPSRKAGVTPENENRYRREGARFIYKLGNFQISDLWSGSGRWKCYFKKISFNFDAYYNRSFLGTSKSLAEASRWGTSFFEVLTNLLKCWKTSYKNCQRLNTPPWNFGKWFRSGYFQSRWRPFLRSLPRSTP